MLCWGLCTGVYVYVCVCIFSSPCHHVQHKRPSSASYVLPNCIRLYTHTYMRIHSTHTHTHIRSNRTGPMSPRTAQKTIEHFTCALEGMKTGVGTSDNIGAMYLGLAQAYDACGPAVRNAAMVLRHGRYVLLWCVCMCMRTFVL